MSMNENCLCVLVLTKTAKVLVLVSTLLVLVLVSASLVLITSLASTADKTSFVPDLYTVHFVVRFGDMDTSAGSSRSSTCIPNV